jgi:hypothetical protein
MKGKVGSLKRLTRSTNPSLTGQNRKREKTYTDKIRDEKGDINTNANEIQRIIREYFENLHSSKLENLDEMDNY